MASVSLYLDEDVRVLLAEILRGRGYDVIHTIEVNRTGKSDEEQLAYAVRRKMAILTHNTGDFAALARYYEKQGKAHFGIIVSPQIPFSELLRRTLKLLSANSQEFFFNQLVRLSRYK
jgi:predicted nuclease of predicted toxin-antitoxin system